MKSEISQMLKISRIISVLIIVLGAALLVYMIRAEDEPGALPLLLIIIGTAWFFTNRYQIKKQLKKS